MLIRLLGDVEVAVGGQWQRAGPAKQSAVLAVLALSPNTSVSQETLIHRVWGAAAPPSARSSLYAHVARLRRMLEAHDGVSLSRASGGGYRLAVEAELIDVFAMRALASQAGGFAGADDHAAAAECFGRAARLWRQRPLDNIDGDWAERTRATLARERVKVLQGWFEAELNLGRHRDIVDELSAAVDAHPRAEDLVAQLMTALFRCGRQSEALAVFARTDRLLREDLGVEPGPGLRETQRRVLRHDEELAAPTVAAAPAQPASPPPRQLPPISTGFVGRDATTERLDATLKSHAANDSGAVLTVTGMAGVGKTTLAVRWARDAAGNFGDGQLFADLHGFGVEPPASPEAVLAGFLRALGVPGSRIPDELADMLGLYRSETANRRLLVLLDNARDAEQVRPLIPSGAGSLTVVTSRNALSGLVAVNGAQRVRLNVLSDSEALELLTKLLGKPRVAAEPEAVARLAEQCGRLPLALRIAAAKLSDDPQASIAAYVDRLPRDDSFALLSVDGDAEAAVRTTFAHSYHDLDDDKRRAFRLLGLIPGDDFTAGAVAALREESDRHTESVLRALESAHLIESTGPKRYRLHDLLRAFARELAHSTESEAERRAAMQRLYSFYIRSSHAACDLVYPQNLRMPTDSLGPGSVTDFAGPTDAKEWLRQEQANLVMATRASARSGTHTHTWMLADGVRNHLGRNSVRELWHEVVSLGLRAAQRGGDRAGEAVMRHSLAARAANAADHETALEHHGAALRLWRELGDAKWETVTLSSIGDTHFRRGHFDEAIDACRQAVDIAAARFEPNLVPAFNILGILYRDKGNLLESATNLERVVRMARQTSSVVLPSALCNLSLTYLDLGRLDSAHDCAVEALAMCREQDEVGGEIATMDNLARILIEKGAAEGAACARQARELSERHGTEVFDAYIHLTLALGTDDPADSAAAAEQSLAHARRLEIPAVAVEAEVAVSRARRRLGDHDVARKHAAAALEAARTNDFAVLEGKALTALAELGGPDAVATAEAALRSHQATGHRPGEARTLMLLSRLVNDPETAERHRARAAEIFADCGMAEAAE